MRKVQVAALALAMALAGCAAGLPTAEAPLSAGAASNALAVDLYRQLSINPGNLVVSPTSLAGAMAPVALGAQGETRAGIDRALHFGPGDPTVALGADFAALTGRREGARVDIANALWVQGGFALKPAFVGAARRNLGAEVASLDFVQSQAAAARINRWASDNTAGRIPTIVSADSLGPATRLVVTNAVYLFADWQNPFKAEHSGAAPFTGRGGKTMSVRMMRQHGAFRLIARDGVKAIELPYRGGRLAMTAILPDAAGGLPGLERRLDAKWLAALTIALDTVAPQAVELALPKLRTESEYQLAGPLSAMGMGRAFSEAADFGGIADAPLSISEVVQKTFLKIDEKGTEAAAVTAVMIVVTGMQIRPEQTFIADHPFLFLIRDRPTGQILFIGRIEAPVAG